MSVRATIKAARESRGWSQRELSRRAGVSVSYISMLERGERNRIGADILQQIALALNVPIAELLDGVAPPIDTSAPPVDLWHALRWPEKLIRELVEDWPDYSEAERAHLIQQAEETLQVVSQRQRRAAG